MKQYVMKMEDGTEFGVSLADDRAAVMFARRANEAGHNERWIADVLCGGTSILTSPWPSNMERITQLLSKHGFVLQRLKTAYIVESEDKALLHIVPQLTRIVAEDLGGHVLTDTVCVDFRKRQYRFKILFD